LLNWRVIEASAGTKSGEKGTNLMWDGFQLHALTSGAHYVTADRDC